MVVDVMFWIFVVTGDRRVTFPPASSLLYLTPPPFTLWKEKPCLVALRFVWFVEAITSFLVEELIPARAFFRQLLSVDLGSE